MCDLADAAFGAAAYGAAHMGLCGSGCPAGQQEGVEGRHDGVEGVDALFDAGDVGGVQAAGFAQLGERGVGGQIGAYDKEFVLYEAKQGVVVGSLPIWRSRPMWALSSSMVP